MRGSVEEDGERDSRRIDGGRERERNFLLRKEKETQKHRERQEDEEIITRAPR